MKKVQADKSATRRRRGRDEMLRLRGEEMHCRQGTDPMTGVFYAAGLFWTNSDFLCSASQARNRSHDRCFVRCRSVFHR
uniref:Predicted protein n=1 Tax=Hordeum vulgare subsp. vulgare TaxID=112509 RepID=F2DZS8_HORVV|nr:predicted protein [Hordeum vulgare subsp. vulgare]